jgi:hypothetical protein
MKAILYILVVLPLFCLLSPLANSQSTALKKDSENQKASEEIYLLNENDPRVFPFLPPWDSCAVGICDLSFLNQEPAGLQGWVYVQDGHLYYNGNRIKFYGVNLSRGACFPEPAVAEKLAARLSSLGVNLVRLHQMDCGNYPDGIFDPEFDDTRHLDKRQLDRLDYLISQLKEHGIYIELNLFVLRHFNEKDGVTLIDGRMPTSFRGVNNFDSLMIELQKQYADSLLNHLNTYTQTAYKDEPAIAIIEICNESSLSSIWFSGGIDRLPVFYQSELDRLWSKWYISRLSSGKFLGFRLNQESHDNTLGQTNSLYPRPNRQEIQRGHFTESYRRSYLEFIVDTEQQFYNDMIGYIKQLGTHSLVIGTQLGMSPLYTQSKSDLYDRHICFDCWRSPGKGAPKNQFELNAVVDAPQSYLAQLSGYKVDGSPYLVSEVSSPAPNPNCAQTLILTAVYGCLQDWDGIIVFAYNGDGVFDKPFFKMKYDLDRHPTKLAVNSLAALIFRRGDFSTSKKLTKVISGHNQIINNALNGDRFYYADNAFSYIDSSLCVVNRIAINHNNKLKIKGNSDVNDSSLVSATGELTWKKFGGGGMFTANSERTKIICGRDRNTFYNLGDVSMNLKEGISETPMIIATVIKGNSFNSESKILVAAVGQVSNTGLYLNKTKDKKYTLGNWGTAPPLVEGISGDIGINPHGKEIKVYSLDPLGRTINEVKTEQNKDHPEFINISLNPEYQTLWYEIDIK